MNNVEQEAESPVQHQGARRKQSSNGSSMFHSSLDDGMIDDWAELKCVAVRYFHSRFLQAIGPTATESSSLSFGRQWFSKSDKQKGRLDYAAFLRLFPDLQHRVGGTAAQACWRLFQPGDIHACLRVLKGIYTDPHEFVFDWFAASSFGFIKAKDTLSKKDCRALSDALGPSAAASIALDSMSRTQFRSHVSHSELSSLLSIFSVFPSRDQERALIQAIAPTAASSALSGYKVSMSWWVQWVAYTAADPLSRRSTVNNQIDVDSPDESAPTPPRPPSVYNLDLVDSYTGVLKPNLERHRDFEVVSAASWTALMDLYGGGPVLPHSGYTCISDRNDPTNVYLAEHDGRPSQRHRQVYLLHPVPSATELLQSFAGMFELTVPIEKLRLWHRQPAAASLEDDTKPDLSEWALWDSHSFLLPEVLVEVQTAANVWPRIKLKSTRDFRPLRIGDPVDAFDCERVWRAGIVQRVSTLETSRVCIHFTGFSPIYDEWIHEESGKLQPRNSRTLSAKDARLNPGLPRGGVGLLNLGNTCYLNCAMQCVAATAAWRSYFLDKTYARHINRHNKLGTKGKVAVAFATLLANMWKPGSSNSSTNITSPFEFRKTIAKVKPQFDGCDQHDGHEFIAALLDALHEDLNCPAPATASPPASRSSLSRLSTPTTKTVSEDSYLAHVAWQQHLERNQSIVVDLFHGLLRSQTTCGSCGYRRVQFEPSLFLSLPIAQLNATPTVLRVWMHPLDPTVAPHVINVTLRTHEGNAKMVLDAIAAQMCIRADRLRLVQVQQHRFARLVPVDTLTCELESAVLCCFERKYTPKSSSLSIIDIQVVHRVANAAPGSTPYSLVGLPFVLSIDADASCSDVHEYLEVTLRRFVTYPQGPDSYSLRTVTQAGVSSVAGAIIPHIATDDLLSHFMPPQVLVVDWCTAEYVDAHEGIRSMLTVDPRPKVTLEKCLENFMTQEDIVDGHWSCESCHATDGSRQMDIWKSPDILMLHLKRFHYSMVQHHKVQELVHFPLEGLQLRPFTGAAPVDDDANCDVYDLYAVANHTGGLSEGHYTAYCRYDLPPPSSCHPNVVPPTHVWLNYDDEVVSELPRDKVVSNAAYVLFYRKRVLSTTSVLRVI